MLYSMFATLQSLAVDHLSLSGFLIFIKQKTKSPNLQKSGGGGWTGAGVVWVMTSDASADSIPQISPTCPLSK